MSAVASYCSVVAVLQLLSVSAVSAVIIEGKIFNFCLINEKYLLLITLEEEVCHHCCQGEGVAVIESTSLACSLMAVCSQLGHFTFVKITLWSSFVLAHYGISGVLADYPLQAVGALEYHTPYLRIAIQELHVLTEFWG